MTAAAHPPVAGRIAVISGEAGETGTGGKVGQNTAGMVQALQVDSRDNVATALQDLPAGTVLDIASAGRVTVVEAIARGHKVALRAIDPGEPVIKYGFACARAVQPIQPWEESHVSWPKQVPSSFCW